MEDELKIIQKIGVKQIEILNQTSPLFARVVLNNDQDVLLRIDTPERKKFYEQISKKEGI